jgi:molybdopterin/thiamine biosynthesis adenylyltransferase
MLIEFSAVFCDQLDNAVKLQCKRGFFKLNFTRFNGQLTCVFINSSININQACLVRKKPSRLSFPASLPPAVSNDNFNVDNCSVISISNELLSSLSCS